MATQEHHPADQDAGFCVCPVGPREVKVPCNACEYPINPDEEMIISDHLPNQAPRWRHKTCARENTEMVRS